MNITHITMHHGPDSPWGGIAAHVYHLANGLAELEHFNKIITTHSTTEDRMGVHLRIYNNILPSFERKRIFTPLGMLWNLKRELSTVDIVHIHDLRSTVTPYVAWMCNRLHIPYVISLHGSKRQGHPLYDALFDKVLLGAKLVFIQSMQEEREALAMDVHKQRIRYLPNSIDPFPYTSIRPSIQSQYRHDILALSRLHPIKGIDTLIKAVAGISSIHTLLTIGGTDEGEKEGLKKINTGNTICMIRGHLSKSEKLSELVCCEVVVIPSLSEAGIPYTLMESLLSLRPVIISSAIPLDLLHPEHLGIIQFKVGDAHDLATKIRYVLDRDMSTDVERGRRWVLETFGIRQIATMAERAYERAINVGGTL